MGLNNHKVCLGKMPPFPSHPNGTCSPAHSAQNTRCFLSQHWGPELGPSCISPLFTTTSNACLPVMDRDPGSTPHCEVQASSHLRSHKRPPQGDCGSFRGMCAAFAAGLVHLHFNPTQPFSAGTKDKAHTQVPSQSPQTA